MKIDYISDVHFDTHLGLWPHVRRQYFEQYFENIFVPIFKSKSSEILIIAGDIGENNQQNIEALRLIRDEIGYTSILFVLGNHDWFLSNRKAIVDYETSLNRVNEMKGFCEKEKGLSLLDGNIVKIDGIRFGGAMGWYDGRYIWHHLNPFYTKDREYINRLWKEYNPDYDNIIGIEEFDGFYAEESAKIEAIYKACDVMITHYNPSIRQQHTQRRFREDDTTGFFTFDGSRFLAEGTMKHWIFGHQHWSESFDIEGVLCHVNAFGYPSERRKEMRIKSIDL